MASNSWMCLRQSDIYFFYWCRMPVSVVYMQSKYLNWFIHLFTHLPTHSSLQSMLAGDLGSMLLTRILHFSELISIPYPTELVFFSSLLVSRLSSSSLPSRGLISSANHRLQGVRPAMNTEVSNSSKVFCMILRVHWCPTCILPNPWVSSFDFLHWFKLFKMCTRSRHRCWCSLAVAWNVPSSSSSCGWLPVLVCVVSLSKGQFSLFLSTVLMRSVVRNQGTMVISSPSLSQL